MPDFSPNLELPAAFSWLIALWVFAIGAAIGSFLNVVVYRLPRGISLVHPGSRCPRCGHAIRWHDNVPVLGWLLLKGRCRDCRSRISPRYPFVEALVGIVFVTLAACEILLNGEPLGTTPEYQVANGMAWGRCAFHALLICTLLAAGLMEVDRQRPPLKLFLPVLLVGLVAPLVWPELRALRLAEAVPPNLADAPHWLAAVESLAGIGAGLLFGCLAWPATGLGVLKSAGRWMVTVELVLIGCYLGWQAVPVGAFGVIYYFGGVSTNSATNAPTRFDNLSLPMAIAALLGVTVWPRLATFDPTAEPMAVFIVVGGLVAAGSLVVRYIVNRRRPSHPGNIARK